MSKDNSLIFDNFQKGMASHPAVGIGLLRQIDTDTYPGIVRLRKAISKITSSTIAALPYWIAKDPNSTSRYFALDAAGQLYMTTNSGVTWAAVVGETAGGGGQGMAIWKGYVIVARATALDAYSIAGTTWANSFKTDMDATQDFHTMLTSIDDKLYICCGRYIYSITELTTFDPATGSTFTATARAITLPQFYNAKCLVDLGSSLMIGTWKGITGAIYEKVADILPYNRSTLTLGIPIKLGENGVHAMITVSNRLYAIAGINAKLFITDGSSAIPLNEISNYAINITGIRLDVHPGAICYHRNKIYFGIDNSAAVNGNVGVWSFSPFTKKIQLEHIISTGNDGLTAELAIGSLFSFDNEKLWLGWKDFSGTPASGIDETGAVSFIQSYGGVIETEIKATGEALRPRTFTDCEIYLIKPLLTGQGVRIKYRKNLYDSFTTLATFDYATYSGKQFISIPKGIIDAVFLQLRIELTSTGSNTPELAYVRLQ